MDCIDRVLKLMEDKNISVKDLSRLSGISEKSLERYLAKERPLRYDIINNLAKALGVSISYLENGYDSPIKPEKSHHIIFSGKQMTPQQEEELIKLLFGDEKS